MKFAKFEAKVLHNVIGPIQFLFPTYKNTLNLSLLFSFFLTPSFLPAHSPTNKTTLSYPALVWENGEENDRRPKKSQRNGVKVRLGQRSWREKVGRKEGGKSRRMRRSERKESKGGSRSFGDEHVNWVRCRIQKKKRRKDQNRWYKILLSTLYYSGGVWLVWILDNNLGECLSQKATCHFLWR